MPIDLNYEDFFLEQGNYATGTDATYGAAGNPAADPYNAGGGAIDPAASKGGDPNIANLPPEDKMATYPTEDPGPHDDPPAPDMPNEVEHKDFEQWKKEFYKESIKGNVQDMKSMLQEMQGRQLSAYQRKFLWDNMQIVLLREHDNINKACAEIRKQIKDGLDHNNPATSIVTYMAGVLDTIPMLNNVFIKLNGLYSLKPDLHRKFIASLTGSVQVGSGSKTEDIIHWEKDYSIKMSTRMNARFGDVYLDDWSLRTDDPERYLKAPELQRLQDGSPEEKDVLRRRVVMESIAELLKERAFIIHVVSPEGTIHHIGWDISTSLKSAYTDGRLVVRNNQDDGSQAMIDDDGAIISFTDTIIKYVKDTGEVDEDNKPVKKEIDFINCRTGQLFLTASLNTLKEAASTFPGLKIKDTPWTGNPSDLQQLEKCVPSVPNIIMQQCG